MSSDPSEPQGLPKIGRLKKMGETAPPMDKAPEPEENVTQAPEEENVENEALPEEAPAFEEPVPEPVRKSSLRLKDQSKSNLNREEAVVEVETEPQEPAAVDDSLVEEEVISASWVSRLFGQNEQFTQKTRRLFLVAAIILVLAGLLISLKTAIFNAILVILSSQCIRLFSMQKFFLAKLGLFPGRVLFTAIFCMAFIAGPLCYKNWQSQGGTYLEELQSVEDLANKGQEKIKQAVEEVEKHASEQIDAGAVATHEFQYSNKLAKSFHEKTYLSGGGLLSMYLQYTFLLSALLLLPFCRERQLIGVEPLTPSNDKWSWKLARYGMLRLIKAGIITLIFIIGLKFVGYENSMFIAGTAFVVTALSQFGAVAGLILCIPIVIRLFSTTDTGLNSLIAVVLTGLVALIVEKKLHWFMVLLPMKKDGILPPSLVRPVQHETKVEGGASFLPGLISLVVTLAFYGAIAFGGYRVYDIYTEQSEGRVAVNKAIESLPEGKDKAFDVMENYRQEFPADREVLFAMAKAYLKTQQVDKALELADAFKDFEILEDKDANYLVQAENFVRNTLSKSNKHWEKDRAHKWLVMNYPSLYKDELNGQVFLKLGQALYKVTPKEVEAHKAIARSYYLNKDLEKSRTWCNSGLEINAQDFHLICLSASIYCDEGKKLEALQALIPLGVDAGESEEVQALRKRIANL